MSAKALLIVESEILKIAETPGNLVFFNEIRGTANARLLQRMINVPELYDHANLKSIFTSMLFQKGWIQDGY